MEEPKAKTYVNYRGFCVKVIVTRRVDERKVHATTEGLATDDEEKWVSEDRPFKQSSRDIALRRIGFYITREPLPPEPETIAEKLGLREPTVKPLSEQVEETIEEIKDRIDEYYSNRQVGIDTEEFKHGIERSAVPSTEIETDDGYPNGLEPECTDSELVESVVETM